MAWGDPATDSGAPTPTANARFARLRSGHEQRDQFNRELCTRLGCIMEDASVVALIWNDDLALEHRLQKLGKASADIHALLAAAAALMAEHSDP